MQLYTYFRSSSAYRVRLALAFKGIDYTAVPVHLVRDGGEQFRGEFRELNPVSQVPVLAVEEAGVSAHLAQSVAIIEYLEERFPEPPLLPKDYVSRARVRELVQIINSGIQPFQNRSTLGYLTSVAPELPQADWLRHFLESGLHALELRAARWAGEFLFGDAVSMADLYLVPELYAARRFRIALDPYVTLLRAEARCQALPAFASAHPDQQPDAGT